MSPPAAFVDRCGNLHALGVDHVVAVSPAAWSDDVLGCLTAAARG